MSYKTTQTLEKDEATGDVVLRESGQKVNGTAAAADLTTSDTDTTLGRVMKVGNFGLGYTGVSISDWNDTDLGNCFIAASSSSALNRPSNASTYGFQFGRWQADYAQQFGMSIAGGPLKTRNKRLVDGVPTWFPWREFYDQANILGTVSQSAGVPTGAIIERGSNVNGEYVKFADGTLICTGSVANTERTFPAPFIDTSYRVSFGTSDSNANRTHCYYNAFPDRFTVATFIADTGVVSGVSGDFIAIGRWF